MRTTRLFFAISMLAGAMSGLDVAAQPPKVIPPLLSGFNPDPTICRVGKDYYLATSSFELLPGIPIYHSTDLRNWTVVSHAWTKKLPCKNDDYGIWAPTLRHHGGMFYIVVTWRGGFDNVSENYLLKAKDPRGPWSEPMMVDDTGGIDPSLFFDDDGTAWYIANRAIDPKKGWNRSTLIWMQRIDLETGRRFGEEHILTKGVGKNPKWVEGPHLYKIDGKYVLAIAQGGTSFGHGEFVLTSDCVAGPYVPLSKEPLLTAVDWGKESPYQSFGHADIVDTPDGRHFAVFLGRRYFKMADADGKTEYKCPLGRETFLCPVKIGDGVKTFSFERGKCIAGRWDDPTQTRYLLMSRPDDTNRYVKARVHTDIIDYPDKDPHFFGALRIAPPPKPPVLANPVFDGWYADPQIRRYGDTYWVFPTTSARFAMQTSFDAFSSKDMKTWTKHLRILATNEVKWAKGAMWAPDAHEVNGKYYLFFSANDAYPKGGKRVDGEPQDEAKLHGYGGIGVAVADKPEGPYRDLIGKPLIDQFWNRAQPIDQYVFEYKGEWYMVYGGWGRCNLVKLAKDFKSLVPFEDGSMWCDMTPKGYVEGSVMFERKGRWYFMYSSGKWTKDSYCVNYSVSDSPFGPFEFKGKVLGVQRPLATGAGHHSVICAPGTDEWYICYHRRPIPSKGKDHRVVCIDRMEFDANGDIKPVVMTE